MKPIMTFIIAVSLAIAVVLGMIGISRMNESWNVEEANSHDTTVKIIRTVVTTKYKGYSETECVYEYNGETHITHFKPCVAGVGDYLQVHIDSHGNLDTWRGEKYVK